MWHLIYGVAIEPDSRVEEPDLRRARDGPRFPGYAVGSVPPLLSAMSGGRAGRLADGSSGCHLGMLLVVQLKVGFRLASAQSGRERLA